MFYGYAYRNRNLVSLSSIIDAYKARVLADDGTFEGEANLLNQNINTINDASFVFIPSGYKAGKVYSMKPTDGSGDLAFSRGSAAYRYNSNNLLESVGSNIPRISFVNNIPTLLIEPLRTNVIFNSSDVTNVSWSKVRLTATNTSNSTPISGVTARKLEVNSAGTLRCVSNNLTGLTAGTRYTFKQYIKRDNLDLVSVIISDVGEVNPSAITYNFATNTLAGDGIGVRYLVDRTSTILNNGWVLITIYLVVPTAETTLRVNSFMPCSSSFIGVVGNAIQISNVQLETGTVPSSDIITGNSAVTRVADVASVTRSFTTNTTIFQNIYLNAGSLSDGGVYVILDIRVSASVRITLYRLNNTLSIDVTNSTNQYSGIVYTLPTLIQNTVYKIAIVTTATSFKVFVNGGLRFTSGVLSMPNLTGASFAIGSFTTGILQYNGSIINTLIQDTNLNDSEAINLTT